MLEFLQVLLFGTSEVTHAAWSLLAIPIMAALGAYQGYKQREANEKQRLEEQRKETASILYGGYHRNPTSPYRATTPIDPVSPALTAMQGGLQGLNISNAIDTMQSDKDLKKSWQNYMDQKTKIAGDVAVGGTAEQKAAAMGSGSTVNLGAIRPDENYSPKFPKGPRQNIPVFDVNNATREDFNWLEFLVKKGDASEVQKSDYERLLQKGWR